MTRVGVGIIGLGVGERHIAGFRRHPAAEVVALCDIDPAKQAMARARYPGVRVHAEAEALIDDPDVAIVSVASYDDAHFAQVARALERGKHVFVEKPICLHDDEFRELRRLHAARPGLRISSNLILRRAPRFVDLRERIRGGRFGQVYYVEGDYDYGRLHKIAEGWRGTIPFYSVVHGGAIHLVDLLTWLTGSRIVEVEAVGNRICAEGTKFRYNDLVVALLRFESGAVGKVSANFGCVRPHFHRLSVYGTDATFENRPDHALLWTSRDPAVAPERLDTAYPGADKGDLIPGFVDAVLGRGAAEVEAEDVFASMAVCLAIERAVREHRAVPVETIPAAAHVPAP